MIHRPYLHQQNMLLKIDPRCPEVFDCLLFLIVFIPFNNHQTLLSPLAVLHSPRYRRRVMQYP